MHGDFLATYCCAEVAAAGNWGQNVGSDAGLVLPGSHQIAA